ncbi:MAG TPA: DUF1003 domain-containing protein [Vicinamibacterales bacterium]|nr:DUF1003 domain-containing protein [Vicinamibacterales bacterium]
MAADNHNLADELRGIGRVERDVIHRFIHRKPVARNLEATYQSQMTFGERVADRVAAFGGSWTFIGLFLVAMMIWMAINSRGGAPLDPFPFILLNLILSCLAALQAPVIMMSQNRQAAKDRLDAQHDYEVNLKAEMEIVALHFKMDELREKQWALLMEVQNRQTELLTKLCDLHGHEDRPATS